MTEPEGQPPRESEGEPEEQPEEEPRPLPVDEILRPRRPRTRGGAIYRGVLTVTGIALLLVVIDRWREGLLLMGTGMLFAAMARSVVREDDSGMLGLRSKPVDVVTMVLLGGGLVALSMVIPDRPG